MPFLFANKIKDYVRDRNLLQRIQDKRIGRVPPEELPNYTVSGITNNGTYFLFTMVFKRRHPQMNELSFLKLIDDYAQCTDENARKLVKAKIEAACGKDIDGLALVMYKRKNYQQTFLPQGFVTGSRIKLSGAEIDKDGIFTQSKTYNPDVFILENEEQYTEESIQKYLESEDDSNPVIDPNINAIKCLNFSFNFEADMDLYLKSMSEQINNEELKTKIQAVYAALQKLKYEEDCSIKYRCTCLTIQLLSSTLGPERDSLLVEYKTLANEIYGSKFPWLMSLGATMIVLGTACAIFAPLPLTIIMLGAIPIIATGIIAGACGGLTFFSTRAVSQREHANTLLDLKEALANLDLEPSTIEEVSCPERRL